MFATVRQVAVLIGLGWGVIGGGYAVAADETTTDRTVAAVTKATHDITESGREFGRACGRTLADQSSEKLADVRLRFVDCLMVIDNLRQAGDKLEFAGGAEGRALKAEYAAWLKSQADFMQAGGLGFIRIVDDKELSQEDRYKKLMAHAEGQAQAEREMGEKLSKAVKAYVDRQDGK
jgi:hypothetical protein